MAQLTAIAIENFKGIGDRVELQLRPITLLFGANSAGKSTVLHALHYAREIFERHNLDPDRTIAGGTFVDLGGFEAFVHKHDRDREVKLGFTLAADSADLSAVVDDSLNLVARASASRSFDAPSLEVFCKEFAAISIDVGVCWSHQFSKVYVASYDISLDGESIVSLHHEPGRSETQLRVDLTHAAWKRSEDCDEPLQSYLFRDDERTGLQNFLVEAEEESAFPYWEVLYGNEEDGSDAILLISVDNLRDALPDFGKALPMVSPRDGQSGTGNSERQSRELEMLSCISELFSQIVIAPGILLQSALMGMRYLGPLRETPGRGFGPPRFPDPSRWSSGLGAWDQLLLAAPSLVDSVSHWLGGNERLNAGYTLERRSYKELDLSDPLVHKLITGRAFDEVESDTKFNLQQLPTSEKVTILDTEGQVELQPHDVGIGISQVVPVLVSALDDHQKLITIEQPELHLHPRLQSELGDLFIESALGQTGHSILLETHSEHLILRLLRRIRETTEGDIGDRSIPLTPQDIAVYYIQPTPDGARVELLEVDETGDFIFQWPNGFFEERAKELF